MVSGTYSFGRMSSRRTNLELRPDRLLVGVVDMCIVLNR